MTEPTLPQKTRKTPENATAFEREQLRFFLSQGDLATLLAKLNPSLAWLPVLSQMKLVQSEGQLVSWIERNFGDVEAVRDVVANLRFFGPDTANLLESRLNTQAGRLPPLLVTCWRLIIRHMRTANRALLQSDWFEIAPRVKRGEVSADLFERVAEALRPKLRLSRRFSLAGEGDAEAPEHPWQLMSIDYEVEEGLTAEDVLSAWPSDTAADADAKLLSKLTDALSAALEDATEVGVEVKDGYSASDSDVPSVAQHEQNSFRTGFQAIVRVAADLWERLIGKSPPLALPFVNDWINRPYRLLRRLAVFACANPAVPSELAADVLIALTSDELFLTNTAVEVFRLVRARWNTFPKPKQEKILRRLSEGPLRNRFRDDADADRYIDRARFDYLAEMERDGFELDAGAEAVLDDIRARWPQWQLRPAPQAGFHVWHESGFQGPGESKNLEGVPDAELVGKAKGLAASAQFREGDSWQALCLSDPDRALRGLDASAQDGDWTPELWQQLLWARKEYAEAGSEQRIAELLLRWPSESFGKIVPAASSWLNEHAKTLDDQVLWPLWDRVADAALAETENATGLRAVHGGSAAGEHDSLTDALNALSGRLAEILLKKLTKGSDGGELPVEMRGRLNRLVDTPGRPGFLARIRLAAEVSLLFERAPDWTRTKIVPLFEWTCPDARDAWAARKYSNYIGSPQLFGITKSAFLEMFRRSDVAAEDLRAFAEWLTAILIANQLGHSYPLLSTEARSALRHAGDNALASVGHRLAVEMQRAKPEEKVSRWRTVVGPVFQTIWPLDTELQTPASTFKLTQILRAAGEAFPEAADVIIPFIHPDDPRVQSTLFSIAEAPEQLYAFAPGKMLDLVAAVVGGVAPGGVPSLSKVLDRIRALDPSLVSTGKFQRLLSYVGS